MNSRRETSLPSDLLDRGRTKHRVVPCSRFERAARPFWWAACLPGSLVARWAVEESRFQRRGEGVLGPVCEPTGPLGLRRAAFRPAPSSQPESTW